MSGEIIRGPWGEERTEPTYYFDGVPIAGPGSRGEHPLKKALDWVEEMDENGTPVLYGHDPESTLADLLPRIADEILPATITPGDVDSPALDRSVRERASQGPLVEQYEKAMSGDDTSKGLPSSGFSPGSGPMVGPGGSRNGGTDLVGRGLLTVGAIFLVVAGTAVYGFAGAWGGAFLVLVSWGWIAEIRDRRRSRR